MTNLSIQKNLNPKKSCKNKKSAWLLVLIAPVLIYLLVFKYIPIVFAFNIALRDYTFSGGIFGSEFVGFANFKQLFLSSEFYSVLKNTILLNVYLLIFSFPFPILLAILLNEVNCMPFKRTVQSILYVPHFISWIVLGGIIISILSPSTGVVNNLLKLCGIEPVFFMASEKCWPVIFVLSDMWQSAGWGTIIYLAAITGIDPGIYEAGRIDGANKLKQIIHITLPSIGPTIAIMLILRTGRILDTNFDQIYALQNKAVLKVSDVVSTYEYRIGLQGARYSYTSALGLFKSVIGLLFITFTNKMANKFGDNGLW